MRENRLQDVDILQAEIQSLRPVSEHMLKQLKEYYRVGFTFSSNALEGNTLTLVETKVVLEDGLTVGGKTLREHNEALGHSEAYDYMYEVLQSQTIIEENIKKLHHLFFYRIDEKEAGSYRSEKVIITGSEFVPPSPKELSELMQNLCKNIPLQKSSMHTVEYAAWLHKEFVEIHPFVDGNGRLARLLMNIALMQGGFPVTIIPPVLRFEYIECLEQAHRGNTAPFVSFITAMVYESQKDFLRLAKE